MDSEGYMALVRLIQEIMPGHWLIHALSVLLLLKLVNIRISGKIVIEFGKSLPQEKPEASLSFSESAKTIPASNN